MSQKVLIQYTEYRRAFLRLLTSVTTVIIKIAVVARDSHTIQNMENSRHINRMYVERDHSLRMRRHERIDHAAVYQKCIKTNAENMRKRIV